MSRILLANSLFFPNVGGVENSLRAMSEVFLARGYEVDIFTSDLHQGSDSPLPKTDVLFGARVFRYPYRVGLVGFVRQLFSAIRMLRWLQAINGPYELVVVRNHVLMVAAWFARLKSVHYIVPAIHAKQYVHQKSARGLGTRVRYFINSKLQLLSLNVASNVVVLSTNMRTQVLNVTHGKVDPRLLMPGVDQSRFRPVTPDEKRRAQLSLSIPEDSKVVLCLGRFAKVKGFNYALDAMAYLPESWHLIVVGEGPEAGAYIQQMAALDSESPGLAQRVRITPKTHSPESFYCASDVFVLPSLHEPFGQVLLEATACGLPIVAFAGHTGVETATEEIYAGFPELVEFSDSLSGEALAEAIRGLSTRLGRNQAEFQQQRSRFLAAYSWEAMVDRLLHPEAGEGAA